ncbi:MAG: hypothetical protein ABH880_02770 [Patescibacteria group bacterium]
MENDEIKDVDYYRTAQAALLSYDSKLWQIPALFFTVVGLLIGGVGFNLASPVDGVLYLFGSILLWVLILLHNKAHVFHVSIAKKIDEFDSKIESKIKRIPFTSMSKTDLNKRICELEERPDVSFSWFQKSLASITVSKWIRRTMVTTFVCTLLLSFASFGFDPLQIRTWF